MRNKVSAAIAALAIAFVPTAAQAASSIGVTDGTNPITSIVNGDHTQVTSTADISKTGALSQSIYTQFSPESLQLQDTNSVITPENWTLEYTTDGKTWSATAPSDLTTVRGVRTVGDVSTLGNDIYQTTSTGTAASVDSTIQGTGSGDGFDASVFGNYVFNVYHHVRGINGDSFGIDCHDKTVGAECFTGGPFYLTGYSTSNSPSAFYDAASHKVYVGAGRDSDSALGMLCIDLTDIAAPASCSTEFVQLGASTGAIGASDYAFAIGAQSQIGTQVFWTNSAQAKLECFDISTGLECSHSDWTIPGAVAVSTDTAVDLTLHLRSGAFAGKLFYFSNTKMGCYDPTTGASCNSSAARNLISSAGSDFTPFPVTDASGAIIGVCSYINQQCIDTNGANAPVIPAALSTFITSTPVVGEWLMGDSGKFGYYGHRLYMQNYGATTENGGAPDDIYCFDYATGAQCAGFDGTNLGAQIYAISADPSTPGCIWTNGNMAKLTTFQFDTGAPGCDFGANAITIPYEAMAPRMSCTEAGRVLAWDTATFTLPAGLNDSQVFVTFQDADGYGIDYSGDGGPSFVNIHPVNGVINMSDLNYDYLSAQYPGLNIKITAVAGASSLSAITTVVKYQAETPQLCMDLEAVSNCPSTFTPAPTGDTISNGVIETVFSTTPRSGKKVSETQKTTLNGTNVAQACAATLITAPKKLAWTGESDYNDKLNMGLAGMGFIAAAAAMIIIKRRRSAE
jgi:hypothetical protein